MEFVYEIQACVKRAALVLLPTSYDPAALTGLRKYYPGIQTINFQAGTLREITETLDVWSKSDTLKYEKLPIVCLVTPFAKRHPAGSELEQVKCTLFIACGTQATLRRQERQTKTFEPVLNPIVKETINQIINSVICANYLIDVTYTEIEHDYWAKDKQKSIFNEYVDAIEIRDLIFNLTPSNCL